MTGKVPLKKEIYQISRDTVGWVNETVYPGKFSAGFSVLFEFTPPAIDPVHGRNYIMALDNIQFLDCDPKTIKATTPIPNSTPSLNSHSCDFEYGNLCSWKNEPDQYPWTVMTSEFLLKSNQNNKLIPRADHTLNTSKGHFAYLSHEEDDTNLFRKSVLSLTINEVEGSDETICLTLWYQMRTVDEVQLKVIVSAMSLNSEWTYVTVNGDQGDQWKKLQITIPVENGYQLKINALAKLGVVAIDDISSKRGAC